MADGTHIEWCRSADGRRGATWNFITGCSIKSSGCTHCYAMKLAGTRLRHHPSRAGLTMNSKAGPVWTGEVRLNAQWLDQPLQWREPRTVFVCAHGDLFHEDVPDEWIDEGFAIMAMTRRHTYQVLTKRADRMRAYMAQSPANRRRWEAIINQKYSKRFFSPPPILPNVWLGVSVEDQRTADERIPDLLTTHAALRWISAEPLLGPIDLMTIKRRAPLGSMSALPCEPDMATWLKWVVVGGESGDAARPMHPDWPRQLRDQCAATGVPFLFKQWGAWCDTHPDWPNVEPHVIANDGTLYLASDLAYPDGPRRGEAIRAHHDRAHLTSIYRLGKKRAGRTLDGVVHDGFPVEHWRTAA